MVRLVKPRAATPADPVADGLADCADVQQCIEDNADPEREFSGPQVDRLSRTEYLWGIPCGRGAYNFSYRYIVAAATARTRAARA